MRRPIEKLARILANTEPEPDATIGELAEKYDETPQRILDSLEVLKILEYTGGIHSGPISYVSFTLDDRPERST